MACNLRRIDGLGVLDVEYREQVLDVLWDGTGDRIALLRDCDACMLPDRRLNCYAPESDELLEEEEHECWAVGGGLGVRGE